MRTLFLTAPSSRNGQTDFQSDRAGKMNGSSLVGTILAGRFKILKTINADSFKAHDLVLDQTVTVRQALRSSQPYDDTWRQKVQRLALVRHPNFLNGASRWGDHDRDNNKNRPVPVVPEANAGWVLVPFFGAVLVFSSRQLFRAKA